MLTRRYLETEIVNHCNLACMECSHHSPHMAHGGYPVDEFTRDVNQLAKAMRVKEFRLLGGEPLLSENLSEYVAALRQSGLAESIGICTNGILLRKVDEKILDLLDVVEISLYPVEPPIRKVIENNIARLKEYDQNKIKVNTINQFRFTSQVFENPDKALVKNIYDHCWVKDKSHVVYRGYYFKCVTSQRKGNFLTQMNGSCDQKLLNPETDGVSIYADDFPDNLIRYLASTTHLYACNWCMGTSGKLVDNVQNKHNQHMIKDIKELRSSLTISAHPGIYSRLRIRIVRLWKGFKDLLKQLRRQARTAVR
jgi:GTP 3',8-cyclase